MEKIRENLWLDTLVLFSILALMLAGCGPAKLGTEDNPIVMAFVSSGDAQEIIASGDQIAQQITDKTGLVVQANAGTDFAAVREAMGEGKAHIGWLNTFNYVMAHDKYGVDVGLVTVRLGLTSYKGQFNVRANSGITSLQDLKGKVMCWGDPNTGSGYIVPRIMLQANGIDPDNDFARTIQAASHKDVITRVYNGECNVGTTYADARSSAAEDFPDVEEVLTVLATTADIPYDSISFAKDFPEEMREQIISALLEIARTEEGQGALKTLYSIAGLQRADDSIYDGFRADLSKAGTDVEELAK